MLESHIPHPRIKERSKPHLTTDEHSSRLAIFITKKFGTMGAFYVLVIWMFGWMILATLGLWFFRFDPYPFTFLLFLSNLVQLFALPVLAVGQRVLSQASDKQAEQTFRDAEAILKLQDEVHRLTKIIHHQTAEIHRNILKDKNHLA